MRHRFTKHETQGLQMKGAGFRVKQSTTAVPLNNCASEGEKRGRDTTVPTEHPVTLLGLP